MRLRPQSQLAILGGVTLGEDIAGLHTLSLHADGAKVDCRALVGFAELGNTVFLDRTFERYEFLFLGAVVVDTDCGCIHKLNGTLAFGHNLCTAVAGELCLDAGTDDRTLGTHQRNSLAHHVRSHERAVGVVVFKEGNQRCRDGCDLCGRNVHKLHIFRRNNGEIGIPAGFHGLADKGTVGIERSVALGDGLALLDFSGEIYHIVVVEIHAGVSHLAVGSLDEAQVVNLGIHAQRTDKTDVRSFGSLDGAQTAIVCIVHVAHLETGTFAGKTAGAKGAHTALVGYFGQRVGLVHELRQSIGAEERVDNARDGLGVNKVESGELFAVADVHSLADSAGHARKTYTELVVELLADSAYAAVCSGGSCRRHRRGC